jgi:hypothetical protein
MLIHRKGPLIDSTTNIKDPCPVFDGQSWHLFGTIGHRTRLDIFHAKSDQLHGPYHDFGTCSIPDLGPNACAPGVVHQDGLFHMFIQTEYYRTGGRIVHCTSRDGSNFEPKDDPITPVPGSGEAGIYDPHPAIIGNTCYLTYSGFATGPRIQGDIYIASGPSWDGPWERIGCILRHEDVPFHNQKSDPRYEWGLEGSMLIEDYNQILLFGVCFLPTKCKGSRQRVFLAHAPNLHESFQVCTTLPTGPGWESGENGHATAVMVNSDVHLFYQARMHNGTWNCGTGVLDRCILNPHAHNG